MAIGLTNTLPRSSCGKCVKVLKELISGLDEQNEHERSNGTGSGSDKRNNRNNNNNEPSPLILLRAIARSSNQHPRYDKWGQERKLGGGLYNHGQHPHQRQHVFNNIDVNDNANNNFSISNAELTIEETEDGVKMTIPVETTAPAFMKKWTQLEQPGEEINTELAIREGTDTDESSEVLEEYWSPLATSVVRNTTDETETVKVTRPLTIELKCRRCETSGPEAGARAFLMGPDPLSIVLCHNRIDSEIAEVEEILTHELIHLYDVQTLQLDLGDCETVAYSEVRAAREAECHRSIKEAAAAATAAKNNSNNNNNGASTVNGSAASGLVAVANQISETLEKHVYNPYCVRNIAMGATQNMFPNEGKACLNKVWETAYRDHRPFARTQTVPQQQTQNYTNNNNITSRFKADEQSHESSSGTIHGTSGK